MGEGDKLAKWSSVIGDAKATHARLAEQRLTIAGAPRWMQPVLRMVNGASLRLMRWTQRAAKEGARDA